MFKTAQHNKKHKHSEHFLAYAALTTVTLLWALAGPVIKLTLHGIPPMHFLFLRLLIVCIVILPALIMRLQKNPVSSKEIPTLIALGLFSQSSLALSFIGYQYATALDAAIITLISPLLSVAAGHLYFNEKVSKKTKIGLTLATVGTALIIFEPLLLNNHTPLITKELRVLGNILILSSTVAFLIYTIWSKYAEGARSKKLKSTFKLLHLHRLKRNRSALEITFITFYVGLATTIPLVFLEAKGFLNGGVPVDFNPANLATITILGILYMAIFSSIVAYTLFEWALQISSVTDTAFFNYLSPIFVLPFAYVLLGEIPTTMSLIGGGIIAAGVIIAEHK
ncbi:EamA family transporter [candidate division WWE3 bacterium]|nr:EamA family transporter [candidate division WWE3 bacterium]